MTREITNYLISLLLFVFMAGCGSSDDGVEPDPGNGKEPVKERSVWSFEVKVMLDRATYKSYGSSENIVKGKLQQRFKEVRELYHGKKGIIYFDADFEFIPVFEESHVYDCSSMEIFNNAKTYRGNYPYLVLFDGKIGDFPDEEVRGDWTGWGNEVVRLTDNNKGTPDGGATIYDILSAYKTSEALAHEFGHARGVPDIYAMEIKANPVSGQLFMPVTCIMNLCWGGDSWSEYAQLIINKNKNLVYGQEGFQALETPFYPKELELKVTKSGAVLPHAQVNLYPEYMYQNNIETTKLMSSSLSNQGTLKIPPTLFFNQWGIHVGNVLIEVMDGEAGHYRFLPVYEFQTAYLKGDTEKYIIEMKL